MATVDTVTTSGVANSANNTSVSTVKLADDFQQFLTLLTTQLQNQDPLSPMDSTEFTNQLVQFSQVEQQINTNAKLDNLVAMQLASISSVALGYVGMDISYISTEMNYDGATPIDITYALAEEAVTSKINVYNEDGELVYSADAPKNTGMNAFTWSGIKTNGEPVPAGTYTVKIDALNKAGTAIENSTVVTGHVDGIETQNGVVYVLVGERAVPISSIVNANLPGTGANNNAAAALGYVGMDVTYSSNELEYTNDPVAFNYSLSQQASAAKIKIYNENNTLVYTAEAARTAGNHSFTWNGLNSSGNTVDSGTYKVVIDAVTTENEPITTNTYFNGHVDGVETKGGVNYVTIGDRTVPVSAIMNAKTSTTQST